MGVASEGFSVDSILGAAHAAYRPLAGRRTSAEVAALFGRCRLADGLMFQLPLTVSVDVLDSDADERRATVSVQVAVDLWPARLGRFAARLLGLTRHYTLQALWSLRADADRWVVERLGDG
jgi:hypothetical protein